MSRSASMPVKSGAASRQSARVQALGELDPDLQIGEDGARRLGVCERPPEVIRRWVPSTPTSWKCSHSPKLPTGAAM